MLGFIVAINLLVSVIFAQSLPQLRIINGDVSQPNQFPWHVSVRGKLSNGQDTLCGGALISPSFVITAAHCVTGREYKSLTLGFGSINLNEQIINMLISLEDIFVHPQFNQRQFTNDLALIRLPFNLTYSNQIISTVRLPTLYQINDLFINSMPVLSGFGRTDDRSQVSQILRYARLRVLEPSQCVQFYGNDLVTNDIICVSGQTNAIQGACASDNGGPLVILDRTGFTLIGIGSFISNAGCSAGHPSGFVRVSAYLSWISYVTGIPLTY